jgi:DNA-directed RNA polymerase, sigma subunit (sigma70/sigma32)
MAKEGQWLFPKLYDAAWRKVRAKRNLWHKVYDEYINSLPPGAGRGELIEKHLRIVGPIAGQIAWRRTPHSFGIWAKECQPNLSHVGLVHELTAMGNLVLFIAADRYDPESGWAFSTYANFWIKKLVRLYLEELICIVPRTGHMGVEEEGTNAEGEKWVVYKPRRSVMDHVDAALDRRRLFRGKAAGGMAIFDQSLTIPGPNPGDKEIETVGTDGPTLNPGMDYLQRRVSFRLYPWTDMGANFTPRFELKGHPGGRASADPPRDYTYKFDATDEIKLKSVPFEHTGPSMVPSSILAEDNDNLTAMLEGRKLSGIPRHKIFEKDDYSPYERLERQCRAIREASLQTHINPNGGNKQWRKPTIGILTYPRGTAFAIAAE